MQIVDNETRTNIVIRFRSILMMSLSVGNDSVTANGRAGGGRVGLIV